MKILHLLKNKPDRTTGRIIEVQAAENDVTVVDLSAVPVDYDRLVADVFGHDRVFCW
jgi:hypothetical protein